MNKEYICEKCGTEMVPIDKKIPVGLTCPNCGWGWATTYIDPIIEDDRMIPCIVLSYRKKTKR